MDASNVCYDKLAHIDNDGHDGMVAAGFGLPEEYVRKYPFSRGDFFPQATKMVLIVRGQEARLYIPSPDLDLGLPVSSIRQSNQAAAVWSFDLQGYSGGHVGARAEINISRRLFIFGHEIFF